MIRVPQYQKVLRSVFLASIASTMAMTRVFGAPVEPPKLGALVYFPDEIDVDKHLPSEASNASEQAMIPFYLQATVLEAFAELGSARVIEVEGYPRNQNLEERQCDFGYMPVDSSGRCARQTPVVRARYRS
ncbi:hypothetical protein FB446DRAFT_175039 [Lentinula raphanica]|nr:hypothetical protein FB446DRAFT_175039 [Lentinula raphanica]